LFQSIVISPDQALGNRLVSSLQDAGNVAIAKHLDTYPTAVELARILRAHAAEIIFLSFESLADAVEIARQSETEAMHVQIVGFHKDMDPQILHESMRAGVREFLIDPFPRKAVMESLLHVKTLLDKRPVEYATTNQIFTFLPSKAGTGTSTIAANTAGALARRPDMRVLLADFDMSSGMLRFMLKLGNEYSVSDAMEHADNMDENLWPQLVTAVEGMDVLHAGPINPNLRIEPKKIRNLVAFMRRHYGALCFDLSGNLEKYSLELMAESKRILLVCTPEIPSLHLAREKLAFLRHMDLDRRVSVVLTRLQKKSTFTEKDVTELVEAPVLRTFPNDYPTIQRSLETGTLVPKSSELGKSFEEFAGVLAEQRAPTKTTYKHKFLEFTSPIPSLVLRGRA
jgi:pilus assembly protein CpaE